jgi:hypothetical protein
VVWRSFLEELGSGGVIVGLDGGVLPRTVGVASMTVLHGKGRRAGVGSGRKDIDTMIARII